MSATAEFPALSFACPQLWAQMHGDEKTRFCDVCQKNVHNLSLMTTGERSALLTDTTEQPCVAYFKHLNGPPIDVIALPETNPLKRTLTQAAMASLGTVALTSIAVNSLTLIEAYTKDYEAPTTGLGYSGAERGPMMMMGVACPPPGSMPPPAFATPPQPVPAGGLPPSALGQ